MSKFAPRTKQIEIGGVNLTIRAPSIRQICQLRECENTGSEEAVLDVLKTCVRFDDGSPMTEGDVLDMPADLMHDLMEAIGDMSKIEKGLKKSSSETITPDS